MTNEEINLIKEFKNIANKKWIKSISRSFGSIGLTFENELDKKPDSMYFPDYHGIEVKCTSRYSRYPLFLFTLAFDGPSFPEIDRIVAKYGWYDKEYVDRKVLFAKLNCKKKNIVNNQFQFKLELDEKREKMFLAVYDLNGILIEMESFVYVNSIYNHLMLKFATLAYIHASRKEIDGNIYFRYYQIEIYKLISFERFLELLLDDVIDVSLISRISKSGEDKGRYRNKNLVFNLKKTNINKLFKRIYFYNSDIG